MALLVSLFGTAIKGGKGSVQAFKAIHEVVEGKQEEEKNGNVSLTETIQKAYENKAGDK